jgi:hypothetical protein
MDSRPTPRSGRKARNRPRLVLPAAALVASLVAAGCATVQPTQSGFIQPTATQPASAGGQALRYRSDEPVAWARWEIDDVQWLVQDPDARIDAAEIEALRADLRRSLELAAATPAVASDPTAGGVPRTLRIRAAITQVALPSPTLNVITTALLFIPLDRGGAAVEIEAIDVETGRRVAALASAGTGTLADFRGHYSRLAHAELAFQRAAQEFRSLLDGTDGHKS